MANIAATKPRTASHGAPAGQRRIATPAALAGEDRYRMIAEAAYYLAEQRGFRPGSELDDWLAAEVEVDALLADAGGPRG